MIVLKFSYHCYSEATRFSHAYIFSPRCKIPHSFENFYNFIYQTTLLSRISCDTISTQNRKLFSTFIVTRKNPFQISFADGIFAFWPMCSYGQRSICADLLNSYVNIFILYHKPHDVNETLRNDLTFYKARDKIKTIYLKNHVQGVPTK